MSFLILIVCALFVIALVRICKLYLACQTFIKKIESIPGPPPRPIIGNVLDFKSTTDILPVLMKHTEQYGHTFKLLLGPNYNLFTSDLKLIEHLLTSSVHITKSISYRFLFHWLGNGLLTATNPKWKIHRRLLTPTFHIKILDKCLPIFYSNVQNLISQLETTLGQDVNIHEDVVLCTLDIMSESAMGISINALKQRSTSQYVKSVNHMTKMVVKRTFSMWRQIDFIYKRTSHFKRDQEACNFLHNVTDKIIQTKRKEMQEKQNFSADPVQQNDDDCLTNTKYAFLDMLLRCSTAERGSLSDYDIRQEVDTFMFAGYDTTSSGISFALYLLSNHPEIQETLYQEVSRVLGYETGLTMEKLNELKYLEMIIKETLRLLPAVPIYARELTEDFTFNGQLYPKGLTMSIFSYALHRREDLFEDCEKFNPERFSTENCSKRSTFAYIPFSAGPRNCIGQKFAMLEMKSTISLLIQQFKFSPSTIPVQIAAETVLTSTNGIHVRLEKRLKS